MRRAEDGDGVGGADGGGEEGGVEGGGDRDDFNGGEGAVEGKGTRDSTCGEDHVGGDEGRGGGGDDAFPLGISLSQKFHLPFHTHHLLPQRLRDVPQRLCRHIQQARLLLTHVLNGIPPPAAVLRVKLEGLTLTIEAEEEADGGIGGDEFPTSAEIADGEGGVDPEEGGGRDGKVEEEADGGDAGRASADDTPLEGRRRHGGGRGGGGGVA